MLLNPFPDADDDSRVIANTDPVLFQYFFRKMFAGERGVRQAILNTLLQRLHAACVAANIDPSWDPEGSNITQFETLLSNCNFHDQSNLTAKPVAKPIRKPVRSRKAVAVKKPTPSNVQS